MLLQGLCLLHGAACCQLHQQSKYAICSVAHSSQQLQSVLKASKQGKLTGAAASALGLIARAAPKSNAELDESTKASTVKAQSQHACAGTREAVMKLCEAGGQVAKLPGAAAAKQGVASGLATLLGAVGTSNPTEPVLDLDSAPWKSEAKDVLKVSRRSAAIR